MHIVLASGSQSRKSILLGAGVNPIIHPAEVDEDTIIHQLAGKPAAEIVTELAIAKARNVAPSYPNDVVVGGDSMLLLDGTLQGKPHTKAETIRRWHQQRGKQAQLITGHCIISPAGEYSETATTEVFFAEATDHDIEAYAATGEPLPCAGAFTLEAIGGWFIDRIEGDPSSVIGLSLPVLRRALYHFGYNVNQFWSNNEPQ